MSHDRSLCFTLFIQTALAMGEIVITLELEDEFLGLSCYGTCAVVTKDCILVRV